MRRRHLTPMVQRRTWHPSAAPGEPIPGAVFRRADGLGTRHPGQRV